MPTAQTKVPKYSIDRNDFTRETGIFRPSELCVKIELQEGPESEIGLRTTRSTSARGNRHSRSAGPIPPLSSHLPEAHRGRPVA